MVVTTKNLKCRMVVDYSQTINVPIIRYISENKTSHILCSKQTDNSINSHMFLLVFGMEFPHFDE
ncbi:hypothetical protein PR048_025628 [Dryococelus australis]|uniref:Uncharacterized protein n=1 Tax=Dryococelus australis TaxID=614101 RepID=A0ABQ9GRX3_9NEOP|nr:hypothetical protein PR048_025628 [Dryococelus australis]